MSFILSWNHNCDWLSTAVLVCFMFCCSNEIIILQIFYIFYCFTDFLHNFTVLHIFLINLLFYRFSIYFIILQIFYIFYYFTDLLHNFTVLHIFLIILLFYTFSTYFIILQILLFCRFSTYFTVLQIFCNLQRFTQLCSKLYISVCIERN